MCPRSRSTRWAARPDENGEKVYTDAAGNAKYHAINLADYVTKDDAGKWVVSIPEAAWYVHSDSCQHKDGVGHDSKTDVGCADDLYVVRLVLHLRTSPPR